MSSIFAPKPFSIFEFVTGTAALAPVALIAFFGLRVPQSQAPVPAASSSLSAASIPLPRSPIQAPREQPSEQSQSASAVETPQPVDLGPAGDKPDVAERDNAAVTDSPAADGPVIASAWRLGRWQLDDAARVKQRLIETGLLWGFADRRGDAESSDGRCGVPWPDPAGLHEAWARPPQGEPLATSCDPPSAESRTALSTEDRVAEADIASPPPVEQDRPRPESRSESTFIGGWADDSGECRQGQKHGAPLVISIHEARTASAKCDFQSVKREAASRWHIVARCSHEGESWNAHVDLKLAGSNLTWSSERGTATYVRCLKL